MSCLSGCPLFYQVKPRKPVAPGHHNPPTIRELVVDMTGEPYRVPSLPHISPTTGTRDQPIGKNGYHPNYIRERIKMYAGGIMERRALCPPK